ERSAAMTWSDLASGALLLLLTARALFGGGARIPWVQAGVGVWLILAPVIFRAPTAGGYLNDTLVGVLIIAFAVLIPQSMPMPGPDRPVGWSYSPSTWVQRAPMVALGFAGFFLARYMTADQLGHIPTVWDPLFGTGTARVLHSAIARAFPVSDAGLGAAVYLVEALMGLMGDRRRWRTMPWMVMFFGLLVVPLGIVSVALIVSQPLTVGTWCFICLLTALTTLLMIPLALDEVVAMVQFLVQSHRDGQSVWRTFWLGGDAPSASDDTHTAGFGATAGVLVGDMVRGVTLPWTLLLSAALGVWLMFASSALPMTGRVAASNVLAGALVATVALTALAEVGRSARLINVLAGAWIVAAPWLLHGGVAATVNGALVGVALVLLSLPRGAVRATYGDWARYIR
ncbi:MAG: vitamin K epoxide reductase family protein, partial [Chloroflexota bacterium]|nr:vitamin K epoxide reductase family protein [Chloroflexota bacterium]